MNIYPKAYDMAASEGGDRFDEMIVWATRMGLIDVVKLHSVQVAGTSDLSRLTFEERALVFDFVRPALTWAMLRHKRHH